MRTRVAPFSLILALALMLLAVDARAHSRGHSYSAWELIEEGVRVRFRITAGLSDRDPRRLSRRLSLSAGGERCPVARSPVVRSLPGDWLSFTWTLVCSSSEALEIRNDLLRSLPADHLHFVRLELLDGSIHDRVLTGAEASWRLPSEEHGVGPGEGATSLLGYLYIGVEHIWTGWDHLAFIFALLLLARRLGELGLLVTAFTLAHSVTLALAALGLVTPQSAPVEALIGFSIALLGVENAWILAGRSRGLALLVTVILIFQVGLASLGVGVLSPGLMLGITLFVFCHLALLRRSEQPAPLRVLVAFAFGLVHGFGFAGVLSEIGLPQERLVPALLGFNLGVEAGQLAVVGVAWPILRGLSRLSEARLYRPLAELGSAGICGLGVFWFLTRTYG